MATLGEKISELRKRKGWTQEKLSEIIGVSSQSVSKWENGTTMPDIMLLPIIADIFEVTIDMLFGKESGKIDDGTERISSSMAFDCFCREFKKGIVKTSVVPFEEKPFEEQFKEYERALHRDELNRSAIIKKNGVIYYREDIGGLLLKKPQNGWADILEDEDAQKTVSLLNNKDFKAALSAIISSNMTSFTLPFLCNTCHIEPTDELRNGLLSSGLFEAKSVRIDDREVEIFDFNKSARLFLIFAILRYAKEFSEYTNKYCFLFRDADFMQ